MHLSDRQAVLGRELVQHFDIILVLGRATLSQCSATVGSRWPRACRTGIVRGFRWMLISIRWSAGTSATRCALVGNVRWLGAKST